MKKSILQSAKLGGPKPQQNGPLNAALSGLRSRASVTSRSFISLS